MAGRRRKARPTTPRSCCRTRRAVAKGASMNLQTTPAKPAGSRERSLDEVKAEFMRRAGRLNPFEDIRREDAERVMDALQNLDKDRWAEEWSNIGLGYEATGDARAKAG